MLQLVCSLHVTSCECERRSSIIRRLNTYIRTIMTQKILSSLALLHIHYDVPIDLDKTIDIYSRLHPRRLALDSLNKPYNAVPIDLDKEVDIYYWLHPRRLALDSLINPYNAVPIDLDTEVDIYYRLHPRRLALDSLIKP